MTRRAKKKKKKRHVLGRMGRRLFERAKLRTWFARIAPISSDLVARANALAWGRHPDVHYPNRAIMADAQKETESHFGGLLPTLRFCECVCMKGLVAELVGSWLFSELSLPFPLPRMQDQSGSGYWTGVWHWGRVSAYCGAHL